MDASVPTREANSITTNGAVVASLVEQDVTRSKSFVLELDVNLTHQMVASMAIGPAQTIRRPLQALQELPIQSHTGCRQAQLRAVRRAALRRLNRPKNLLRASARSDTEKGSKAVMGIALMAWFTACSPYWGRIGAGPCR